MQQGVSIYILSEFEEEEEKLITLPGKTQTKDLCRTLAWDRQTEALSLSIKPFYVALNITGLQNSGVPLRQSSRSASQGMEMGKQLLWRDKGTEQTSTVQQVTFQAPDHCSYFRHETLNKLCNFLCFNCVCSCTTKKQHYRSFSLRCILTIHLKK